MNTYEGIEQMGNGDITEVWGVLREMSTKIGTIGTDVALIRARIDGLPCAKNERRLEEIEHWAVQHRYEGRPPSRWAQLMVQLLVQVVLAGGLLLAIVGIVSRGG